MKVNTNNIYKVKYRNKLHSLLHHLCISHVYKKMFEVTVAALAIVAWESFMSSSAIYFSVKHSSILIFLSLFFSLFQILTCQK